MPIFPMSCTRAARRIDSRSGGSIPTRLPSRMARRSTRFECPAVRASRPSTVSAMASTASTTWVLTLTFNVRLMER